MPLKVMFCRVGVRPTVVVGDVETVLDGFQIVGPFGNVIKARQVPDMKIPRGSTESKRPFDVIQ